MSGEQRTRVTSNGLTLNSRELRMWSSMISSRIISFQKVMVKSSQVLHPRGRFPDPTVLDTEEQMLDREQNERDVLDGGLVSTSVTLECLWRMCL